MEVTCREFPDYRVSTLPTAASWRHGVTPYQWLVLFVAWLGWVFDSMDAMIYALVLQPALHDLLQAASGGAPVSNSDIGRYGGVVLSIFLVRLALGGVLLGVLAHLVGGTKALIPPIPIHTGFLGTA